MNELFFELLQISLGSRDNLSRVPCCLEWDQMLQLAEEQAIVGVMMHGLDCLPKVQRPSQIVKLHWIGLTQIIKQQNAIMDTAVVELCKWLMTEKIRFMVVKGQTIAALYPFPDLRQSGDIDYIVHPNDWEKAYHLLCTKSLDGIQENNSEKHVEWQTDNIQYEMHRTLASFSFPKHQQYWKRVVEQEMWEKLWSAKIKEYPVPTLTPIYSVIYTFVHIFEHFIKEGIGLRQIVDWRVLMDNIKFKKEDVEMLELHLTNLGLKNAFIGFGAILTDYLKLPTETFPFEIKKKDHMNAPALMKNILEMGNFGKNKGSLRGFHHVGRIWSQTCQFGHYAPVETLWRIPHMFKWWSVKMWRSYKAN